MQWIFSQRLAGHSLARITRALTGAGIPCPSSADRGRNAHRAGEKWSLTIVRAILANPRYTGRQVWNRQPTAMDLIDPANTGLGHRQVQRWGLPDGWVISASPAHPALVSEEDFVAVQGIRAAREGGDAGRCYRLVGLLRCGICGRRAESCWSNNHPAYRCRHGYSSASRPDPARPKNLYIREDRILPHLPALYMLLAGAEPAAGRRRRRTRRGADVHRSASSEAVLSYLRARQITLTYDPRTGPCRQTRPKPRPPSSATQANTPGAARPRTGEKRRKEESRESDRPALTGARARVMFRYIRNRPGMYKFRVRDLNTEIGAISPGRENHAIRVTGAGEHARSRLWPVTRGARHWVGGRLDRLQVIESRSGSGGRR